MGSKTTPSSQFPCGFNIMGCLGPLHVAGQALRLLIRGSRPKGHGTHNHISKFYPALIPFVIGLLIHVAVQPVQ